MTSAYESATDWNRAHPLGTAVRVALRDGSAVEGRTRGDAVQWGAFAVVSLEDQPGLFTAAAQQPVAL